MEDQGDPARDLGSLPTTAQLMTAMRENPFEEGFKEANRRLSQNESSNDDGEDAGQGDSLDTPLIGRGTAGSRKVTRKSSGLVLRLPPPTLTSQSPGFFSSVPMLGESSCGVGLGTPEIANYVKQVKDDPRAQAPGTAEVLNKVLDFTSTRNQNCNVGEVEDVVAEEIVDVTSSQSPVPPPSHVITVSSSNDSPPLPEGSGSRASSFDLPTTLASGVDGGELFLSLRVGNQMMKIPFNVAIDQESIKPSPTTTHTAIAPKVTVTPRPVAPASVEKKEGFAQSILAGPREIITVNAGMMETESPYYEYQEKRKDTLDRNKEAAIRYRKRKKEEYETMKDKVQKLEGEKFELSTQVSVLKRELDRVSNRLDRHRNCSCNCERETGTATTKSSHGRKDGSQRTSDRSVPFILQPIRSGTTAVVLSTSSGQSIDNRNSMVLPVILQQQPHTHPS